MRLEDICHEAGVTLKLTLTMNCSHARNDSWPDRKIVFVNKSLTIETQKRRYFARAGP